MRIVANRLKKEIFLSSPRRVDGAMRISGQNFHSVGASMHHSLSNADKAHLYNLAPDTFDRLFQLGAIDKQLNWLSNVRIIDSKYHLRTLQIECLLRCNLLCSYCYCSAGNDRVESLEYKKLREILIEAEELGVMSVDFTGGEFLMYPKWKELIAHTRDLNLTFSIHTNASLLTNRNIEYLDNANISHVQISADSHRMEIHNEVRGSNKSFKSLVNAIKLLSDRNVLVYLNLMCHKKSVSHIADAHSFFTGLGANVIIDWIAPFGSEKDSGIGIPISTFVDATQKITNRYRKLPQSLPCGRDLNLGIDQYEPDCGVGNSFAFVTAEGELTLCPTITSRENPNLYQGENLFKTSLKKAWEQSSVFNRYRYFNCENVETCPAGTACRGGCRATALAHSGSITAPDPISCNRWKNGTNQFVDFNKRYKEGDFSYVE